MSRISTGNECVWSTCNVKSLNGKVPHFKKAFCHHEVVAMQETHTEKWQESGIRLRLGFDGGVFCLAAARQGRPSNARNLLHLLLLLLLLLLFQTIP